MRDGKGASADQFLGNGSSRLKATDRRGLVLHRRRLTIEERLPSPLTSGTNNNEGGANESVRVVLAGNPSPAYTSQSMF